MDISVEKWHGLSTKAIWATKKKQAQILF